MSAREEEALRGARADRDAGRRASRLRHGIDRGEALLQRQRAWERPGQGLGWPPGAPPYKSLPPDLESGDTLTLARLLQCECDLDSRTQKKIVRATVKVAMDEEQTREQERVPGRYSARAARDGEKRFPSRPLSWVAMTRRSSIQIAAA